MATTKKKKEEPGEEVKDIFLDTVADLNKRFGKGTLLTLNEKVVGDYDVIPTGSISFDYISLTIGGFARGKMYELRGWEGSGKTTVCGHVAAEAQKKGLLVLYVDAEHALDKHYFQQLGVDIDKMIVCQPDYGEQGYEIILELIKTGKVGLVITDSDSAMLPKSVMEGEIDASNIGKKAKLNSSVYPKLKIAASKHNVCVIITSQFRQQIGMMFGDPTITQGGKALGFYADTIIKMSKTKKKEDDEFSANITKMVAEKNKTAPPFRVGTVDVLFGVGIDKVGEVIDLGKQYEVIKVWGKKTTYKEVEYETAGFYTLLEDNQELFDEIRNAVIGKIKELTIEPVAVEVIEEILSETPEIITNEA